MIQARQLLLPALLIFSIFTKAQRKEPVLFLKGGPVISLSNITEANIEAFNRNAIRYKEKSFAILQFETLPTSETKIYLSQQGIYLLEYIPENAYTVMIAGRVNAGVLKKVGARTVIQPSAKQKLHPALVKGNIPEWAKKVKGMVDVWVLFPKGYKPSEVVQYLKEKKIEVLSTKQQAYQILEVRVLLDRLDELGSLPFIEYVEPIPGEAKLLNANSRNASRAGMLNASVADGGKGLNGEGVVIGIGDAGGVGSHADLSGVRLINKVNGPDVSHAIHVHTTAAGAGVVNELYRGYASKATIISQFMSNVIYYTPDYVRDYGMVITNNSYGVGGIGCGYYGEYSFSSRLLDQQALDFPYLQHVFAAGNDGYLTCAPYPAGYHTTFGAYQAAKNVLTVGATDWAGGWSGNSSRGPVQDGRTKPEITAMGGAVYSGTIDNDYKYGWGTSFASPAVAGGLALLYQKYRQMYGGQNPKSGLMKALMCNGAADLGNKGPDFQYGFGWMHLLRSVEMLEKEQFKIGSLINGAAQNHTITVPANTAQLKVMLYWNDPPASPLSSHSLVNDLDLTVIASSAITTLPKKLDTSATGMLNVATTGADHINNMEQVVIDNPTAGTYSINISGLVVQNPSQEYFVVYDIVPVSTTVMYPAGGERLVPGEAVQISWDSYGESAGTFALQYSTDNGATWIDINTTIDAATRYLWWTVPNTPSSQALVKIERNGTTIAHTSQPFTIIGVPTVGLSPVQCEGYAALEWTPVTGATDYEVMMKVDNEMVPVATTTATSFTLKALNRDSTYWLSVRARVGGKPGRRAVAVSRVPKDGTCSGSISDNDLKLETIVRPVVGRKATSTELSATEAVTIRVKNLDDMPLTGFTARYKLNDREWVTEQVNATIPAGGTYTYTFQTNEDLSAVGSCTLVAVAENHTPDPVKANDTVAVVVRQLGNLPLDLTTPFLDDLESATAAIYTKDTMGLAGINRYDFTDNSSRGRLSTFATWGVFSGRRSIVLGANGYTGSPTGEESVTGTYNLSRYDASAQDLRLSFKARNSGVSKLWVRGSDDQNWIELLDFQSFAYSDSNFLNIEVSDTLLKYGQNFSSSFQLKWAGAPGNYNNLLVDDISIYESFDDMQLLGIDAGFVQSCGGEPLLITLRNSSNKALANVPVRYCITDGAWITETIPFIAPNTTIQYQFSAPPYFSAPGTYSIKAGVNLTTDNFRANDTLSTMVSYASLVKTFPYLQKFEEGDGGWYTLSANPTWEYGTPTSSRISKAASGTKVWKTNQVVDYNDFEYYYLYSPCFEVGGMKNPTLSFSIAMDLYGIRDTVYDVVWVDYATEKEPWAQLIDTVSAGTNWYPPEGNYAWEEQKARWHVVTMGLPRNAEVVRIRIGRFKHPDAPTEGIAIDDIHIYDSTNAIYDGISPSLTVTKTVSGNEWVHFESEGKLLASVHPNGLNLGTTEVQAFLHSGAVRNTGQQYYLNRNITVKPQTTTLTDSATVRMYFLDSEAEALINATGCSGCFKPGSAYELRVSKYSDPSVEKENGTIEDNNSGLWSLIPSGKVTIVPFQKGYYAEFKVKDFSEFWLSNGGMDGFTSLPVRLTSFTAHKAGEDVLLKWTTAQETNVSRFEVELAKGEVSLRAGRFIEIGEVKAGGNSTALETYSYIDGEPDKSGVRYYRLKMVDKDGSFTYSPVRSVVFGGATTWQIYPNPSAGLFNLVYQLNSTENLEAYVFDTKGRLVKQYRKAGSGALQRLEVDLSPDSFAPGIYMLQTVVNGRKEFFKLHKL